MSEATATQWDRFMNRRLASLFYISLECFWISGIDLKLSSCGVFEKMRSPVQRKSENFQVWGEKKVELKIGSIYQHIHSNILHHSGYLIDF